MSKEAEPIKVTKKDTKKWQTRRELALWYILSIGIAYIVFTQIGAWQQRNTDQYVQSQRADAVKQLKAQE